MLNAHHDVYLKVDGCEKKIEREKEKKKVVTNEPFFIILRLMRLDKLGKSLLDAKVEKRHGRSNVRVTHNLRGLGATSEL